MKLAEAARTLVLGAVAVGFVTTGVARLPVVPRGEPDREPLRHRPVVVWAEPRLPPAIVEAIRPEVAHAKAVIRAAAHAGLVARRGGLSARDQSGLGTAVRVSLTQYCLQGTTRMDHWVREGIVAADPRVFPLARYVEIFLGKHRLGRFLVDDTGKDIQGARLDIWNPNCHDAVRFGRRWGTAMLVIKPER